MLCSTKWLRPLPTSPVVQVQGSRRRRIGGRQSTTENGKGGSQHYLASVSEQRTRKMV
jgi:hypothetical protein